MLTFDAPTHTYRIDGVVIPSVTQVIRGAGLVNFEFVPTEVLRITADFGTAVHRACEYDDKGTLDPATIDEKVIPYLAAWRAFNSAYKPTMLGIEERVYSRKYMAAGTIDRVMLVSISPVIVDIKTPVSASPSWGVQTAAYLALYAETIGADQKKMKRWTVQLTPEASVPYKVVKHDDPNDLPVFLHALGVYRWKQKHNLLPKEQSNG